MVKKKNPFKNFSYSKKNIPIELRVIYAYNREVKEERLARKQNLKGEEPWISK